VPEPDALPTPAFFRDLPLPGLTAGPGSTLDFRIGLDPIGPGIRKGHWIWLVILSPLLAMLIPLAAIVIALGLVVALVTLLLSPVLPAARRKVTTVRFSRRHPVTIELDRHPLVPGETAKVLVRHKGEPRTDGVQVALICREEATYRVGTNSRTEKNQVFESVVADLDGDAVTSEIRAPLLVPEDAMHSFAATNNKVIWEVEVRRHVPRGNMHAESAEFQVLPLGLVESILEARSAELGS